MQHRASILALGLLGCAHLGCATGGGLPPGTSAPCPVVGQQTCAGGIATYCNADGTRTEFECDAAQGNACDPDGCHGACAPLALASSYAGCDYYPTVTINPVWSEMRFGVAVASTGDAPTHVLVTRGETTVATATIAPGGMEVIALPWVPELKGGDFEGDAVIAPDPGPTRVVREGAYRLRTDRPVIAYQFSPLEYTLGPISDTCPGRGHGSCNSYSNDASLLLPATALGAEYTFASWPAGSSGPSVVAITATRDGTRVEVSGATGIRAGGGVREDGQGTVELDRGDVLELVGLRADAPTRFAEEWRYGADLTGARVRASAPVQVIAGHACANVPSPTQGYCDHLEEVMLPTPALGIEHVVAAPERPGGSGDARYVLRVVGVEPATTVRFDPEIAPAATIGAGEVLALDQMAIDVRVISDRPVIVAQTLHGSTSVAAGDPLDGDPSQTIAVPTHQYRSDYLFYSSETYDVSYAAVIARPGTSVVLDGSPIAARELRPAGDGWAVATVPLTGEVHRASADAPFGIVVYGYGDYSSYMYPGGMDVAGPI